MIGACKSRLLLAIISSQSRLQMQNRSYLEALPCDMDDIWPDFIHKIYVGLFGGYYYYKYYTKHIWTSKGCYNDKCAEYIGSYDEYSDNIFYLEHIGTIGGHYNNWFIW